MKVSYNWIKELVDFDLPAIDELVTKIGAQLGGVDEVIDLGSKYQGIVIAKVISCQPLEGSDHLNVCRIDDGKVAKDIERGDDGLVQVVCGAPNCREGLLVAWLPPGTTVPASHDTNEPFVLEAREVRGVISNGMLASPQELALYENHEGILELNLDDAKPGADFAETYHLAGEYIIDIENKMFTHRPDCFGMLGVAREIAGILGQQFTSPEWYSSVQTELFDKAGSRLPVTVTNELPELVPRFMAVAMSNVSTSLPSFPWMATYLSRVGIRPINLIVDLTNYFMLLTGQPLHAYDYDKVKALSDGDTAHLVVRAPHTEEKLTLLSGKEVTPRPEAIVIASDKAAIGLGGVMGGANSDIDEQTQNIILECATFDMYSIRRTSMEHGLFTDAVTRYNKGQSPLQNDRILAEVCRQVWQSTKEQAQLESAVVDDVHLSSDTLSRLSLHPAVKVPVAFINERLGCQLTAADMRQLLEHVEFTNAVDGDDLTVTAPFWRTDIELREDVVEEIGRLYGYDQLPLILPERSIMAAVHDPTLDSKTAIRQQLAEAGANEVLTYSFVHEDLLKKVGQDPSKAFKLSNALSPELQYYRMSLLPSLLEKVHPNLKAGYDEFALFELGKTHNTEAIDDDGLPVEFDNLGLVYSAQKSQIAGAAFFEARRLLVALADGLGVTLEFGPHTDQASQLAAPFEPSRTAVIQVQGSSEVIGVIGEFSASVRRQLKLPEHTAGFELAIDALQQSASSSNYIPLSRFPKVTQDISLKVAATLPYAELHDFVAEQLTTQAPQDSRVQLEALDIFQRDDDQTHRQLAFRVVIVNYDRTLTDKAVNELLDGVAAAAKTKFGAERL